MKMITGPLTKETLLDIQRALSAATALPFYIVDYKGEAVLPPVDESDFMKAVRQWAAVNDAMRVADAAGGIRAAAKGEPLIYKIPCALYKLAVPIVVDDQFRGSLIGGPVRLDAAPAACFEQDGEAREESETFLAVHHRLWEQVVCLSEAALWRDAALAGTVTEKIVTLAAGWQREKAQREAAEQIIDKQYRQLEAYKRSASLPRKEHLADRLNMHFWFNALTSAANLSILEGALRTNEMVTLISEFLRDTLFNNRGFWSLKQEIDAIECFLRIQAVRFGDRIRYKIDVPRNLMETRMPKMMTMPFVELAMSGLTGQREGGSLLVKITRQDGWIDVLLEDNARRREPAPEDPAVEERHSRFSLADNISAMKERLNRVYGTGCRVVEERSDGLNRCIIRIPGEEAADV
jgi:two-component system LytT family sensor kinase